MGLVIRLLETFSEAEYDVPTGSIVRLPIDGIAHRALGCEVASSQIVFDDPGGVFTISDMAGFRGIRLQENTCSAPVIFAGTFAERDTARGNEARASLRLGSDRAWTATVKDDNWQTQRRVIHGNDGSRPAETDVARMQWWIASAYSFNIDDTGLVETTNPVNMDAVDYRGRFGIDVINDCMKVSGKNAFIYPLQDGTDHHGIAYFLGTSSTYTSTLTISNDPADVDQVTCFPPFYDVDLLSDPERLFSGIFMRWTGGTTYLTNPTTAETYGNREVSVDEPDVKTQAAAEALAQKYLDVSGFEEDIITVRTIVPADKVNLILAGQRIQVKLRHLPGYESFTYRRIAQRAVSQWNDREDLYLLTLELRDPRLIGGIGTGSIPVPAGDTNGDTPFEPGTAHYYEGCFDFTSETTPHGHAASSTTLLPSTTYTYHFEITTSGGQTGQPTINLASPSDELNRIESWSDPGFANSFAFDGTFTTDPGLDPTAAFVVWAETNTIGHTPTACTCCFYIDPDGFDTGTGPSTGQPIEAETPSGTVDGSNATFTTAYPFISGSLRVTVNGVNWTEDIASSDPTTGSFTLTHAPKANSDILVWYQAA